MSEKEQNRKAYIKEYQRNWMRARRQKWLQENGPCKHCGSWDSLEIDHIDPSLKTMQPTSIWSRTESVREKELANCQVLCKFCHLKKTLSERPKLVHGSTKMYDTLGCRCDLCKATKSKRQMKLRNPKKYKEIYGEETF